MLMWSRAARMAANIAPYVSGPSMSSRTRLPVSSGLSDTACSSARWRSKMFVSSAPLSSSFRIARLRAGDSGPRAPSSWVGVVAGFMSGTISGSVLQATSATRQRATSSRAIRTGVRMS